MMAAGWRYSRKPNSQRLLLGNREGVLYLRQYDRLFPGQTFQYPRVRHSIWATNKTQGHAHKCSTRVRIYLLLRKERVLPSRASSDLEIPFASRHTIPGIWRRASKLL